NQAPGPPGQLMVLGSFCVLAGISAQRFIQTLSDKVLQQVQEVQQSVEDTKQSVQKTQQFAEENRQLIDTNAANVAAANATAQAAVDAAAFGTVDKGVTAAAPAASIEVKPGADPEDPWKGAFGGSPAANGREFTATL